MLHQMLSRPLPWIPSWTTWHHSPIPGLLQESILPTTPDQLHSHNIISHSKYSKLVQTIIVSGVCTKSCTDSSVILFSLSCLGVLPELHPPPAQRKENIRWKWWIGWKQWSSADSLMGWRRTRRDVIIVEQGWRRTWHCSQLTKCTCGILCTHYYLAVVVRIQWDKRIITEWSTKCGQHEQSEHVWRAKPVSLELWACIGQKL